MMNPATIWIVDRDPRRRAALERLSGSEYSPVLGAPEDSLFTEAARPRVVVLGLSSDFEAELDFVQRLRGRVGACGWILISRAGDGAELARLFDTLDARVLSWPPSARELRREIRALARMRSVAPLSQRTGRESLSARFARWFSGDELHWLLRTLDPSLSSVPILVRGETGTGRGLLARYIHAFGSEPGATFAPVFCEGVSTARELLSQLDIEHLRASRQATPSAITIWLDHVDRLPRALQQQLQAWIEFGVPGHAGLSPLRIRWTAGAGEESAEEPGRQLEASLAEALSGIVIRLAPVRDQPGLVDRFVRDTAAAWCQERGSRPREFDPDAVRALELYPWPGNLRELESVVNRTLAGSAAPMIGPSQLCFDAGAEGADADPFAAETADAGSERAEVDSRDVATGPAESLAEAGGEEEDGEPVATAALLLDPDVASTASEPVVEAEFEPHEIAELEYESQDLDANIEGDPLRVGLPEESWTRLLRSIAHEVRNPLVSIRTFSELLPDHHADAEFRQRFQELVGADVRRIEAVVAKLQELSDLSHAKHEPVDIASLLSELLEERRGIIEERRLLVLKELEPTRSSVLGDGPLLRTAFAGIFNRALEWVPERGDLYIASRHRSERDGEGASIRVLLRFQGSSGGGHIVPANNAPTLAESTLEFVAAHAVMVALGGSFKFDVTDRETIVMVDLPAEPSAAPVG
jgi:DNA-binding NtrC family response regulator